MSPFVIGMAVFFLAAAACGALFYAITPRSRVVDERFADLAVKVRVSQGALEGDLQDDTMLRMLFRWAAKRVPPPNMDTPPPVQPYAPAHRAWRVAGERLKNPILKTRKKPL